MGTPAEALSKFWDELRSKARVEIDHPDLPVALKAVAAEAIAGLWQQATAAARTELAGIRLEAQAQVEFARNETQAAHGRADRALSDLRTQKDEAERLRAELDALRLAHAGTQARLQETQAQLAGAHAQLDQIQQNFHAELAKAREAAEAADTRATAAERRALLEIEHERQVRIKADKLAETLRAQTTQAEQQGRQAAVEHAEALTRLQGLYDAALAARTHANQAEQQALDQLATTLDELRSRETEIAALKAEAQTLKLVLERSPSTVNVAPSTGKRRKSG